MKLFTAEQMRKTDRRAIDAGTPSVTLMERACAHIAAQALAMMGPAQNAAVFCGAGNNGGDGIGAAAELVRAGKNVRVFLVEGDRALSPDAAEMERRLSSLGVKAEIFESSAAEDYVNQCALIIDAVYGFGFHLPLAGSALEAAKLINAASVPVLAADMPSGVEADTGSASPDAVRADVTVTFSAGKIGQFTEPGALFCGDVLVRDIGASVPAEVYAESNTYAVTAADAALPRRRRDAHKGDFGRIHIIAGSVGYTGAPSLAARAAIRMGSGLVFLGVPESIYNIEAVKNDEAMPFPLPDEDGRLSKKALPIILERLDGCDACLIGPGLGRSPAVSAVVRGIIKACKVPLVIDADGINAISDNINVLDRASCPIILTPHAGEFARIGGDTENLGRIGAAAAFAAAHKCAVVLKGHRTVSAFADGSVYLNTTGNAGMAKGGSGDVLAGMAVSLLGQGFPAAKAVSSAVWLHGRAGDICAERFGEYCMTPSDVIDVICDAMR